MTPEEARNINAYTSRQTDAMLDDLLARDRDTREVLVAINVLAPQYRLHCRLFVQHYGFAPEMAEFLLLTIIGSVLMTLMKMIAAKNGLGTSMIFATLDAPAAPAAHDPARN